jgi:hypothetical protein
MTRFIGILRRILHGPVDESAAVALARVSKRTLRA